MPALFKISAMSLAALSLIGCAELFYVRDLTFDQFLKEHIKAPVSALTSNQQPPVVDPAPLTVKPPDPARR